MKKTSAMGNHSTTLFSIGHELTNFFTWRHSLSRLSRWCNTQSQQYTYNKHLLKHEPRNQNPDALPSTTTPQTWRKPNIFRRFLSKQFWLSSVEPKFQELMTHWLSCLLFASRISSSARFLSWIITLWMCVQRNVPPYIIYMMSPANYLATAVFGEPKPKTEGSAWTLCSPVHSEIDMHHRNYASHYDKQHLVTTPYFDGTWCNQSPPQSRIYQWTIHELKDCTFTWDSLKQIN